MSYMALARRYRPRRFDDVLGQPSVVQALSNALDADALHPALLLTGTRGVGKTTIARILAKALNCEQGVSSNPCGECGACREIDEGRFVDLLEIDAASRTKVDDTRALLDNVQYAPVRGRYKIYLIDEVHMLSGHSFNALLKTLEEPPDHVKFVLATTDPQKLPVTVLSRCLQLHLRALPEATIRTLLENVLAAEAREAEAAAIALLAQAADGSMRDGLSLLDQALAHAGGGAVSVDSVSGMLGLSGQSHLLGALQAIADGSSDGLREQLGTLAELAVDHGALLDDLASLLQAVAFCQAFDGKGSGDAQQDMARHLAQALPPGDVHVFYDMAVHARRDMAWAPSARVGFEMAVLRMWCFRQGDSGTSGNDGGNTNSARHPGTANPAAGNDVAASAQTASANTASAALREGDARSRTAAMSSPAAAIASSAPDDAAPARVASVVRENAIAAESEASADSAGSADSTGSTHAVPELEPGPEALAWQARLAKLSLEAYVRELARNCVVASESDEALSLVLAESMAHLLTEERRQRLAEALETAVRIDIVPELPDIAPVELARRARSQSIDDAHAQLRASQAFRALAAKLDARLDRGDVELLH